jgi:hypothetical protein
MMPMTSLDDTLDTAAADTLRFSLVGMDTNSLETPCDDAAVTLRFTPVDLYDFEQPTDPDATAIYDLNGVNRAHAIIGYVGQSSASLARRRQIRSTQQLIEGLRAAIAEGWDVGPELVYAERRLAGLEAGW